MPSGLVLSLYDEASKILMVCCSICGANEVVDMGAFEEEAEVAIELDHKFDCPIDWPETSKFN